MFNTNKFQYSAFPNLPVAELIKLWRLHLGGTPPVHLPKSLFAKLLANQLQGKEEGGLHLQPKIAARKSPFVP